MNNSKIVIDNLNISTISNDVDTSMKLRERESELVNIIEIINVVQGSADWSQIKKVLFTPLVSSLEKQLKQEAEKEDVHVSRLHKIQGKLEIARKYEDLNLDNFRNELSNVRKQLKISYKTI